MRFCRLCLQRLYVPFIAFPQVFPRFLCCQTSYKQKRSSLFRERKGLYTSMVLYLRENEEKEMSRAILVCVWTDRGKGLVNSIFWRKRGGSQKQTLTKRNLTLPLLFFVFFFCNNFSFIFSLNCAQYYLLGNKI
jgi:hypothetical protein